MKTPGEVDPEVKALLKEAWRNLYNNNSKKAIVLSNGLEVEEASSTSVEMQLNENKKSMNEAVLDIFGVPIK